MDGNGRWAEGRGLARSMGHRAGVEAIRRVVEAAPGLRIGTLTLYAFSSDNWRRPRAEVGVLFALLREYLRRETEACHERGVRLAVIGRRDRLPTGLRAAIEDAERVTAGGVALSLRIAFDYSARDAIVRAARRAQGATSRRRFSQLIAEATHAPAPAPAVDLLIRTGGEQRLSDFLLWESAYAELIFTGTMWPDFTAAELAEAVRDFRARERRFGALPGRAAS